MTSTFSKSQLLAIVDEVAGHTDEINARAWELSGLDNDALDSEPDFADLAIEEIKLDIKSGTYTTIEDLTSIFGRWNSGLMENCIPTVYDSSTYDSLFLQNYDSVEVFMSDHGDNTSDYIAAVSDRALYEVTEACINIIQDNFKDVQERIENGFLTWDEDYEEYK